jgi:hypothetical protein
LDVVVAKSIPKKIAGQHIKILNQIDTFENVLFPVFEAFLELGIPVEWATEIDLTDEDQIYITAATPFFDKMPKKYIAYNWEMLATDKVWPEEVFEKFRNALEVWDYSSINAGVLNAKGINSNIILPGSNLLQASGMVTNFANFRDLDLAFVGSMNPRREEFWESVKNRRKKYFYL